MTVFTMKAAERSTTITTSVKLTHKPPTALPYVDYISSTSLVQTVIEEGAEDIMIF